MARTGHGDNWVFRVTLLDVKVGLGARVARGLSAPELPGQGYDRMLAVAQQLQLVVGAVALVAIWVLPGTSRRDQLIVTALLLGAYLPWSLLSPRTALLSEGALGRILNLSADLAAISCFALVIPYTRTAVMFGYVLVIAFHAYVSGRAAGLAMTVAALALVLVAEYLAPPAERHDGFTLVMYGVVLAALAIMVDALAAERRRTARHLARLHRALERLATEPTLSATTDSIAEAARDAVNATAVAVLLPGERAGALDVAGGSHLPEDFDETVGRHALRDPEHSPSGLALTTGRALSVPDVAADDRFSALRDVFENYGIRSMVALPLGPPDHPIGVLNAYFDLPAAIDDEDLHLLNAYARQAYVAVARAIAFEKEKQAAVQLAEADQLKSDFVSTVSHELRTPLTSICGFVDTVLLQWERLDDDAKRDLLQRASWNATELRRLIEQILAFSRAESERPASDSKPYALRAGIEELVHHMAPVLRDCTVDVSIPDDLIVMASEETIHHIIGNLLSNASKFSPRGSHIWVTARCGVETAWISVADDGPGIPLEDQKRVFERFYRGTTTRGTRGTGIGLAIVRSAVERLGGSVTVTSEPGHGATFEFTLPMAEKRAALAG